MFHVPAHKNVATPAAQRAVKPATTFRWADRDEWEPDSRILSARILRNARKRRSRGWSVERTEPHTYAVTYGDTTGFVKTR